MRLPFWFSFLASFLPVGLAEDAADMLAVDLHRALQLDRVTSETDGLAELLEQDVGGLVLDVEFAAQMKRRHALGRRDLFPDRHDDLFERQLSVGEHGSGRHRELGATFRLRASEPTAADAVRFQAAAARAIRLAAVVGPAEIGEQTIGIVLGERPDILRVEIATIGP